MNLIKSFVGMAALSLLAVPSYSQTTFLTGFALSSPALRNNYNGPVGFQITVGGLPLTINTLGRVCVAGNSQIHTVKLVVASTGADVAGGSASVNMSGCTGGTFVFAPPAGSVTLAANTAYYVLTNETIGGDQWYDYGTVSSTSDAAVNNAAYYDGSHYQVPGGPNGAYGPPNFQYTLPNLGPNPPFVTTYNLNNQPLRSDYTGFVGMQMTVGASPIPLFSLGRICVAGNTQTHTVKFALASTGADVPGASASVNMAGCTPGQFVYSPAAGSVTLLANTAYYLVSAETNGGDLWYDRATLTTTSVGTVNSSVYTVGSNYITIGSPNTSYVPPNFQSGSAGPPVMISVSVGTNPPGLSFSVDSTPYSSNQTFSWVSGSSHSIATTSPQNVSGGMQQAFSSWSDSGAISHTVAPASAASYTANFTTQYLLTTAVSPGGGGTVVANPSSGSGYYNSGTPVQLTASPNPGYVFSNWSGDLSGSANPQSLTMSAPHSATANFTVSATPSNFITSFTPGSGLRSDFTGFVGFVFTTGSTSIPVVSLGRVCVAGNGEIHQVKFVLASNGSDVAGATANVNMAGCTPGQFTFAPPASPVTLAANTQYYLVSNEFYAGDQWYDQGPVTSTNVASVNRSVYFFNGSYIQINSANTSYVPPNFQYQVISSPPISVTVQTSPSGLSFNVDSNTYTTPQTFMWIPGSPHTIATVSPQNASAGTQQAFNNWSDSGAISHSVSPASPITYTATFHTQYLLTTAISPPGAGTISPNPTSGSGYYDSGTSVQLSAIANSGYAFDQFSGDISGNANPGTVVMSAPHSVTANFITIPGPTAFLTGFNLNSPPLRNDYTGFAGMQLTVGANPLNIVSVGRICAPGNTGTHTVKFVTASNGLDLSNGSAIVALASCTTGHFVYSNVAIVLQPNTTYYLVSSETSGGDQWYNQGTVSTHTVATVNSAVYLNGSAYTPIGSPNTAYVPVDFTYMVLPPNSTPAFVTAFALNNPPLRNDFTGFVGMKFTVGSTPISAATLGRVCVSGNHLTHTVEIVDANTTSVLGSAVVNMAGCTPGQFVYASPSSLIKLLAGASYYLASSEVAIGDQWYDQGAIATTNVAVVNNSVYFYQGNWFSINSTNTSYVPPNMTYAPVGTPIIEVYPSAAPNVFGSPSWNGYLTNALNGLETGVSAIGNPLSDPTAYFQVSTENNRGNIVSSFASWQGFANPTGPFASELGNRLHFGLHVLGNGTKISLSELNFDMESTDSLDIFQYTGNFTDPTDPTNIYSSTVIGLNYGTDGMKGTGDDFLVTSGPATQMVDEIYFVGIGNAIAPEDLSCSGANNQALLDCVANYYTTIIPFNISLVYSLVDSSSNVLGQGSAVVSFVPPPGGGGCQQAVSFTSNSCQQPVTTNQNPSGPVTRPKGTTFK